jgi:hypothetical protein
MHSTDRLYQLYAEHYRRLEDGFSHVRHWYGATDLTAAGIKKLSPDEFVAELRRLEATPELLRNWLLRILHRQNYDEDEIGQKLRSVLQNVTPIKPPHFCQNEPATAAGTR